MRLGAVHYKPLLLLQVYHLSCVLISAGTRSVLSFLWNGFRMQSCMELVLQFFTVVAPPNDNRQLQTVLLMWFSYGIYSCVFTYKIVVLIKPLFVAGLLTIKYVCL